MTPSQNALGGGFRAEIQQLRRSRLLIVLTVAEAVTTSINDSNMHPESQLRCRT